MHRRILIEQRQRDGALSRRKRRRRAGGIGKDMNAARPGHGVHDAAKGGLRVHHWILEGAVIGGIGSFLRHQSLPHHGKEVDPGRGRLLGAAFVIRRQARLDLLRERCDPGEKAAVWPSASRMAASRAWARSLPSSWPCPIVPSSRRMLARLIVAIAEVEGRAACRPDAPAHHDQPVSGPRTGWDRATTLASRFRKASSWLRSARQKGPSRPGAAGPARLFAVAMPVPARGRREAEACPRSFSICLFI